MLEYQIIMTPPRKSPAPLTFVFGGTRGIGAALVRQLLARNHEVVVFARSHDVGLPADVRFHALDLTDAAACRCVIEAAIAQHGHLACFRLAGTFAAEDVERLIAERDRAFGSLTSAQNRHVALVDIRKMTPQGLSGFAAFGQLLLRQEPRALRLAFLIVTNLASMQAQLAAHGRGAQFFFDEAQARTWLLAHTAPPLAFPVVAPAKAREAE